MPSYDLATPQLANGGEAEAFSEVEIAIRRNNSIVRRSESSVRQNSVIAGYLELDKPC